MSESDIRELTVPPDAHEHGGVEVLRAFVVNNGLSISLQRAFEEPGVWGVLFADVARHVARAFAKETDMSEAEVLQQIRQMFDAQWDRAAASGQSDAIN